MPRLDKTGPTGQGSMTGRGRGFCAGMGTGGYCSPMGMGYGYGVGRRRFWASPRNYLVDLEQEETDLQQELAMLREEISELKKQIEENK